MHRLLSFLLLIILVSATIRPVSAQDTGGPVYVVQSGDTLSSIAVKFGTRVAAIATLNNIQDINVIHVGQVLKIP